MSSLLCDQHVWSLMVSSVLLASWHKCSITIHLQRYGICFIEKINTPCNSFFFFTFSRASLCLSVCPKIDSFFSPSNMIPWGRTRLQRGINFYRGKHREKSLKNLLQNQSANKAVTLIKTTSYN